MGNNASDLQALIASGSTFRATDTVAINRSGTDDIVTVSGPEHGYGLVMVVCYNPTSTVAPILRGENGGRTLLHNHVVQRINQIGIWTTGLQEFRLPETGDQGGLQGAVLVSDGPGGRVLGAAYIK